VSPTHSYRKVIISSRLLLGSAWIVALSSIPSATYYQEKLDAGVAAKDISTLYSTLLILVTITSVWSWFAVVKWMRERYDQCEQVSPGRMRLSRTWIPWSWLVPIVSLWYPKKMIDDLLGATQSGHAVIAKASNEEPLNTRLWWATWVTYSIMTNLNTLQVLMLPEDRVPFQPNLEIAAVCILTASYTVWERIVRKIG